MEKIEKKVTINAPVEKIWKALTDPKELGEWMLMPTTFEPVVGKEFTFKAEGMENWDGYIQCQVKEIEVNKKIVYTWNSQRLKGETLVTILVTGHDNKTELTLIHTGWENLSDEIRQQMIEGHTKGWELRLVEKLKEIVEK